MRRQRYLRTSSAQSLCIFCQCRSVLLPTPFITPRRRLNTTQPPHQSAGAAAAEAPRNATDAQSPQWTGYDPNSSLSPSEQRERARLRERREAQEREVREAAEAQRRQREEAAREEQAKVAEQWRKEQEGARAEAATRGVAEKEQRRLAQSRPREGGNVFRSVGGESSKWQDPSLDAQDPSSASRVEARGGSGATTWRQNDGVPATSSNENDRSGRRQDTRQEAQRRNRQGPRDGPSTQQQPQRREGQFARGGAAAKEAPQPKRVAMPAFGGGVGVSTAEQARTAASGWGAGPVERAPLRYDEGGVRRNVNITDVSDAEQTRQPGSGAWGRPLENGRGSQADTSGQPFQSSGWDRGVDQQEASRIGQKSNGVESQGGHDFLSALSGGAQGRQNDVRQRGSADQLGAAFEGRSELPNRPVQRQRGSLSRDPLAFGSGMGQQSAGEPWEDGSSSQSQQWQQHGSDRDNRSQAGPGRDQYRMRPSENWATPAQRGSAYSRRDDAWSFRPSNTVAPPDRQPFERDDHQREQAPPARDGSGYGNERRPSYEDRNVAYKPTQAGSSNVDTLGSYQPPPPPRQYDQQRYGDSGYRATMFEPDEYQPSQSSFDESQASNWQHLRRRNSEPLPPKQQQQQAQRQQRYQQPFSDEWVDRKFQAHIQERPQRASPSQSDSTYGQQEYKPEFDSSRVSRRPEQRCGRCGEAGHIARECNGPIRAKCNICQQPGHFQKDCPENPNSFASGRGHQQTRDGRMARDPFADRAGVGGGSMMGRRTQSEAPMGFGGREQGADAFSAREHRRAGFEVGKEDVVDDVRERVERRSESAVDEKEGGEGEEQPSERMLRSRKFTEEAPRREKAGRGRRRDEDEDDDDESGAVRDERNARKLARKAEKEKAQATKEAKAAERKAKQASARNQVMLPEFVSVATLAQTLGVRYEAFVSRLERLGYDDVFPGKVLNAETSGMIAMEYEFDPVFESSSPEAEERDVKARPEVEDKTFLPTRPPVVTIMGHVDHGKTTILDYLRKSSVAAGEAGGITQHIGAFSVPLASSGKTITFLDTPGHAAFLAMRQRGANVTDIVILVVAADDSVKPQTLEAMRHARAAGVPMIVAVNKMDKEAADLQRVKQDLARHGVELEDFGGETQVVPVSGKTGRGMEELEESVVTLSDILDHRAEADGLVEGWVLEATTKKAGRVATVLVRRGTLRAGCVVVAGNTWARVRSLRNEAGVVVPEVGPGMPVEVDGWRDQPAAGDEVLQVGSEQKAGDVVEWRREKEERERTAVDMEAINAARRLEQEKRERERIAAAGAKKNAAAGSDEDADTTTAAAEAAAAAAATEAQQTTGQLTLPFIIKADVSGSAEAVSAYILSVSSPLIRPQILRSSVGSLNESDVELAAAAQGHIIAFNLPADEGMKGAAEARGVRVLENNIIYRVLDDVKGVMEERLPAVVTQRVLGEADVGAKFEIGVGGRKKVWVAGCKVRNGVVGMGRRVRVLRGGERVYDGTVDSLKNVKKDVQEMRKGAECGMGFDGWEGFEVGDQVQTYEESREKRRL